MIKISLSGKENLDDKINKLNSAAKNISPHTNDAIKVFAFNVLRDSKDKYILKSGKTSSTRIASRSGRLRSSINAKFFYNKESVNVEVGSNVVYAAIHEYGGKTSPHKIFPRKKKVLAWGGNKNNREYFAKYIYHPGSKIPARPFIKPAIDDNYKTLMDKISEIYRRYTNN